MNPLSICHGRSVLEEEDERGVAHIVEHLAFSATRKYTNHDIIKFLESIGAEFGACQNAVTSADDTVYELLVPVDKPELLSQAISVLAEFSSEVSTRQNFVILCLQHSLCFVILSFMIRLLFVCRFECRKRTWRRREELSWKSIEEVETPRGGCRMLIGC